MTNDISTALKTLRAFPDDAKALEALKVLVTPEPSEAGEELKKALASERAFHAENNQPALCVRLIETEVAMTPEPAVRAALLVDKARLLWADLWQVEPAREAIREALQLVPDFAPAATLLQEMDAEEKTWQEQAEALSAKAAETTDGAAASPLFASEGDLLLRHRSVTEEAEALFRRSLELDPHNRRADFALERLLRRASRLIELGELLGRRLAAASSAEEKGTAGLAAGRLAAEMGDKASALEFYRQGLLASPADERTYLALDKLFADAADVGDLVKIYEGVLKAAKRGPGEVPAALALGELQWKRLSKLEDAEQSFRRAKKAQPFHPRVIAFYRDYFLAKDEIPQLLTLLGQAQKNETDPELRIQYGIEMATVAERRPQLVEKAIDAWKLLLRIRPGLPQAVEALRRLYTKAEKWNALLELLKDQCEALPPSDVEQKVQCYLEMVPIYRDRLKLEVMVINTYAAILALRPDHSEALVALAERYEAQSRWGDLAGVLTRQAQVATEPAQKMALFHRIAKLWIEKFGNHHNAIAALEKILEIDAKDPVARATLREIYTRGRSWRALLDLLRRELPALSRDDRRTHLAEMATLAAERLADLRQAIGLWNEVLELSPADRTAVMALAGLYEREKRWPALAEILSRLAESAGNDSTPEGCALLERRGLILLEKMNAGQAALDTLRRVHAKQPENPRVLRALREAYSQTGDIGALETLYASRHAWDDLCDVLSTLAERTADMRLRTRAFERVADIARNKLGHTERVIKAYEGILATESGNREIARQAADLYEKTERWGRLLATLELLLGPESAPILSPEESLPILERARLVCEHKLEATSLAFKWCARAYRMAPKNVKVRDELERLAEAAEEWGVLLALFEERLQSTSPAPFPDERLALLRRCLAIVVSHLERPDDLQRFAETILVDVPGDLDAETALVKLFTEKERWADLVRLQHARQRRLEEPTLRCEALLRIARLEEEKLGDAKAATRSLQEAVEAEPENQRALRELARLLEEQHDYLGLVAVLARQAHVSTEGDRAAALVRLGRVYERELGEHKQATHAYLQALELDNISAGAVEGLERLFAAEAIGAEDIPAVAARLAPYYELTESYAKWAKTLESLVRVSASDAERRAHLEMLADLYAGPLGDAVAAYGAVQRIFEIEPSSQSVRERLVQLGELVGKLPEIAAAARRVLAATTAPTLRQELLMLLADVEERQPGRQSETEAALRGVLEIDPLHVAAYRALCRICKDAERWGALRDLIAQREKHIPDARQRIELLWQIMEIDEGLLYDRPDATATLRRIIELDPSDLKAYRILERHYSEADKWRELDELLQTETAMVSRNDIAELKARRAELALAQFGDAAGALQLVTEVLDMAPGHAQAIPLLERALAVKETRHQAAEMLDELYTASGHWIRLVEILDIEREELEGAAAIELLVRKAKLQETKLDASETAALATWRTVLDLDPHATQALGEAERLGSALGKHDELIALYQTLAEKHEPSDVAGIADLLSRAARLCVAHIPDRQAAITAWRRVLDLDPSNAQTGAKAADALELLYIDAGDMAGLVHVLRTMADWATDEGDKGRLLLRVAELEENRLTDIPAAVATYRGLLDGDPAVSSQAFDNLDRIFQKSGQSRERVDLLKRRLDHLDAQGRRSLRFLIAELLERELSDLDEAVAVIRPILDDSAEDAEALTALARLFALQGAAAEHLEVLERLLQIATNDHDRIDLLRRIAGLLQGPLARPAEALDRWREILRLAPGDAGAMGEMEGLLGAQDSALRFAAAETLEPIYSRAGDFKRLAGILRIFVELADDGHARASYRQRLAGIEEVQLGDKKAAFKTWAAAIKDATADPELDRLLDSYERLATAIGPDTVLDIVDLYRAIEPDILADTIRMRVQQSIAQHAIKLGDLPVATDYFNRIVERRPDDDSALAALETIYEEREEHQQLYEVILRRADLAQNAKAEQVLRRRAAVLAQKLGRHEDAISSWERVWAMNASSSDAVAALDGLYTELGRWDDLSNLLERCLERGVSAGTAVDLRFRLAEIQRVRLANRTRALEYLATVLAGEPDHAKAIAILKEMLGDPEVCVEAANLLEPVYIRHNAWRDLVTIDSLRLKFSEDPELRLAWTQRIAQVYEEQIEDLDEAFNWYSRVFQEKPTDVAAQEQLLRLAPKQNRWRDLGRLLDEYLDGELSNTDEVLGLVRTAFRVYDLELGDRDKARKHYRRYVEALPGDRSASRLYEEALERWQAWGELRDQLGEQARIVDSAAEKVSLLRRSAELSDEKLSEPAAAIDDLRTILELDPDDKQAATDLDRVLAREERWDDLRDHVVWMLGRADEPHARDALTLELAGIEAQHLGQAEQAVDHYGEVLARSPSNAEAIAALEGLLTEPELRARVAELLEPAFRTIRDLPKLASILEVRLETLDEPSRRIAALREIATIQMHLGHAQESLSARARAWLEDVTNAETLVEVESQVAALNAFEQLVAVLEKGAELTMDPDLRADLFAFKANVLDARLHAPERAIEAWRQTLGARPDHQDAFVALERLLGDAGRTVELCETLEKHADVVVEAPQREALIKRVAALYESPLGDLGKAIAAWRSVLDLDQENSDALDALVRLYAATEDWEDLVEVLQQKIDCTSDAPTLRSLRFQAAELLDMRLERLGDAAEHLRQILANDPEDAAALEMLASIFVREKQYGELVEVLDRRARAAQSPVERDRLAFQAAQVTEQELLDVPDAIARYRRILDDSSAHEQAREALWALSRGEDHRAAAVEALEPLLRLAQEWKPLCELLELRLSVTSEPAQRLEVLADIAQVQESALADPVAAFATWARAVADDPASSDARTSLERMTDATGNYGGLAEVYEEQLKAVLDSELQGWFGSRLADLYENKLGKPERAVELWRDIENIPGSEGKALSRQESLLRGLGRMQDLADVLAREAEAAAEPQAQAEFWSSLGDLRLGPLSERDEAIAAFRSALDASPGYDRAVRALRELALGHEPPIEALDILEPLVEERGDFAELMALIESRLTITDDSSDKANLLRRLAEICESKLGDLPRAIAMLGRALVVEPDSPETVDNLERVAEAAGLPGEAAKHIETVLDAIEPMLFAEMASRAARLHLRVLNPTHEEAALRLYVRVLEADPENAAALEALDGLYRQRGDHEHLAEIIERRGAIELDPSHRMAFYAEAASLHEGHGNLAAAIAAWRSGREGDETNQSALDELARLYEAAGERENQVEMLREKVRMLDDGHERCEVLMKVASIKAEAMNDADGAIEAVKEALDADPRDQTALSALVGLEEKRGDFSAVEDALLRQSAALDGAEQVPVLMKLAKNASEGLNDPDRALLYLNQILTADPEQLEAFKETVRVLTSLERWHELIDLLERQAEAEGKRGNHTVELDYRVQVAAIWGEKLGAEESALEALQAVLERNPNHFPSLMAVARIHENKSRWTEAATALEQASSVASSAEEHADVLCQRAAVVAAIGGGDDDVVALYDAAVAAAPAWLPAIQALEALARKGGDNQRLVAQLRARLKLETDEGKQKTLLSEIASLCLGPLGKPGEAIEALERLSRLSPNDLGVKENLGRALIGAGRVDEGEFALGQLVEQLGKAKRQKDVARLQCLLGTFAEARGDLAMAKQRYAAAYQIDPTQAATLGALARLSLRQRDTESARRFLRTLLLQSFDEKVAGITKSEVYLALGNLHRDAGENAKARNMYERGLEMEPRNEALKQALAGTPKH